MYLPGSSFYRTLSYYEESDVCTGDGGCSECGMERKRPVEVKEVDEGLLEERRKTKEIRNRTERQSIVRGFLFLENLGPFFYLNLYGTNFKIRLLTK